MFGKGGSVKEILMYNSQHTAKLVPLSLFNPILHDLKNNDITRPGAFLSIIANTLN